MMFEKAEYQGREVELDKPFRTPKESKKFAVYVKDEGTVKIVRFGDSDMEIKRDDPKARANFRARHKCDEKKDKTTPGYWSCFMWNNESVSDILKDENMKKCFGINCEIKKVDEDKQLVYGWAYVSEKNGDTVIDHSGESIQIDELQKAFHGFMKRSRQGGDSHNVVGVGEVVEGMVFTKELQEQLGVDLGKVGAFICMKVNNKEVWEKVKSGEFAMFSIGGSASRREI